MCTVNDNKRNELQNKIDNIVKIIEELDSEKESYDALGNQMEAAQSTLNSISSNLYSLGDLCSYVKAPAAVDRGQCASYAGQVKSISSQISALIGDISSAKAEIDKEKEENEIKLERMAREKNAIPPNCGRCTECCQPYAPLTTNNNNTGARKSNGACFTKGTKVLTNNGYKEIEKIKPKDMVLSFNEEKNIMEYKPVIRRITHKNENTILFTLTMNKMEVKVTEAHRIYVKRNNKVHWIKVSEICLDDMLMNDKNKWFKITKIKKENILEDVYNLSVKDNHTYFVSENNILVHNVKTR